ncbi:hypothetical protein SAMN06272759_11371 [Novosphingobium sp. B1]|nr:hypothetical protein SAMN06272759_11371 [Novosphingobium sp. B1]
MTRHTSNPPDRRPLYIDLQRKIHQQSRVFSRSLSGFGQRIGNQLVADVATKCRFVELQGVDDAADNVDVDTVFRFHFEAFPKVSGSIRIVCKPAQRCRSFKPLAVSGRKFRSGGGA